jgi:Domain of unknown function (DUF1772)
MVVKEISMVFMMLQVLSVCLIGIAAALPLAHALEWPGKKRLDKAAYLATQPIYYPGFTVAAGIGEGGGMIAAFVVLLLTPGASRGFRWSLAALVLLVAMHAAYWVFVHPINKFWLRDHHLKGVTGGFIRFGSRNRVAPDPTHEDEWRRLRNRWEHSHVLRAVLAAVAFICAVISIAL